MPADLQVILPEGATDVTVDVPFQAEQSRTVRYTYLDSPVMGGRPVLILHKRNVVREHNVPFKVSTGSADLHMLLISSG